MVWVYLLHDNAQRRVLVGAVLNLRVGNGRLVIGDPGKVTDRVTRLCVGQPSKCIVCCYHTFISHWTMWSAAQGVEFGMEEIVLSLLYRTGFGC